MINSIALRAYCLPSALLLLNLLNWLVGVWFNFSSLLIALTRLNTELSFERPITGKKIKLPTLAWEYLRTLRKPSSFEKFLLPQPAVVVLPAEGRTGGRTSAGGQTSAGGRTSASGLRSQTRSFRALWG